MARIRSIKPELLEDEKTATLSHLEWRLFVSLLLLADDYGNFRATPGRVSGAALWAHLDEDVTPVMERLGAVGLIRLYVVDGQRYGHVNGWEKHQKVDHPGKPSCPSPPVREVLANGSRDVRETVAPDLKGLDLKEKKPAGARTIHAATGPEHAPRTVAEMGLAKAFAEERAAVLGGFEWNVRAGDPAKEAERARQLDEANVTPVAVRASMRRFWTAVKSGQQEDAQKCVDKATFAIGVWFDGAKADLERAAGVAPVIAVQARGSPVTADPYANLPRIGAHGVIKP